MLPNEAWISLGGNQGDTREIFRESIRQLAATSGIEVDSVSSLYRTPPWGDKEQPAFLNAVMCLRTDRDPFALLHQLQALEGIMGRRRDSQRRWGPRTLDLDLLVFGALFIDSPELIVPHPRLHERAFVLVPMNELDPAQIIPGVGPVSAVLEGLDTSGIEVAAKEPWTQIH